MSDDEKSMDEQEFTEYLRARIRGGKRGENFHSEEFSEIARIVFELPEDFVEVVITKMYHRRSNGDPLWARRNIFFSLLDVETDYLPDPEDLTVHGLVQNYLTRYKDTNEFERLL